MKIFILSLLLIFNLFGSNVNKNKTTEEPKYETVKEKLEFIKVSDIPDASVNISLELTKIEKLIQDKEDLKEMNESLSPYAESISMLLKTQVYKDVEIANLRELQKMKSELAVYVKQLKQWKDLIKSNIEIYDENKKLLKKYSVLWSESNKNAKIEKAPKSIFFLTFSEDVPLKERIRDLTIKTSRAVSPCRSMLSIANLHSKQKDC